jgi:hypothetical protein
MCETARGRVASGPTEGKERKGERDGVGGGDSASGIADGSISDPALFAALLVEQACVSMCRTRCGIRRQAAHPAVPI